MVKPAKQSEVDTWLARETDHKRKALESASRYFDSSDDLTVNTLEAVYARETSFGASEMGKRGDKGPAGHFQLKADTARRYNLIVTKDNDQRFDIDYASSATARYLKDLHGFFSQDTTLVRDRVTIGVKSPAERHKFVLASLNAGEGRIAHAQRLAQNAGKNPQLWTNVRKFLELAGSSEATANEARRYVELIPIYEAEFSKKSIADKNIKQKQPPKERRQCTEGHWRTIDDHPVFICD